jgi:eukaryotic-like serine/threonine-protein kinase
MSHLDWPEGTRQALPVASGFVAEYRGLSITSACKLRLQRGNFIGSCTLSGHSKHRRMTFVESPPNGQAAGTFGQAAPERLGKYPLLSVIGTGSMGIVYKSFDPQIQRPIALKTIRRELLDDEMENFPACFHIEAQAAGGLTHPGIVCVYEYGEAEGYGYIAMEYVEGHSLRDCLERKVRFNTDQAINILAQLLKALQYAHERGVWHRDVKPANILLTSDGQVKITDFGIARVESSNSTQAGGAIMGTPGFIAPEMYLSDEFDHRIDLFAAGVVFYHLLAGVPPFVGTAEKIMLKVCYETPLPASVIARQPSLRPFDAVLFKALARRPEDRFSSAAEFLEALRLAQAGGPAGADETVIVSRRPGAARSGSGEAHHLIQPASTDSPVTEPLPPSQALEPDTENDPISQLQSTNTPSRAPDWNTQQLTQIEKQLARFVGPIAQVLVRNATHETQDLVSLIQWLAAKIRSAPDREVFLRGTGVITASAAKLAHSASDTEVCDAPTEGGTPLTPEYIARASQLLAVHLGPIAKVLAKRAAQPSSSQEQFVAALAAHLSDDRDRAGFLRELA